MINGMRLKKLRLDKGYTLAKLSQEIGCTASFLSQIERGLKEPSLVMLRKLSDCLSEPIFSLLAAESSADNAYVNDYSIVRAHERKQLTIPDLPVKSEAITISARQNEKRQMRGIIYRMAPGVFSSEGLISHKFDECAYVFSGEIEIYFENKIEILKQGDCIYINELTRHNFKNISQDEAVLIVFNN